MKCYLLACMVINQTTIYWANAEDDALSRVSVWVRVRQNVQARLGLECYYLYSTRETTLCSKKHVTTFLMIS